MRKKTARTDVFGTIQPHGFAATPRANSALVTGPPPQNVNRLPPPTCGAEGSLVKENHLLHGPRKTSTAL
jgi:hypothetical protein